MDEIVCANTAFRYWRCPPQVRDLYPRLPVLAMYELCGWFSVFEPTPAAEMQLKMAAEENRNSGTLDLSELGEGEDEVPWKRVYARATVKAPDNEGQTNKREDGREVTKLKGTSLWMRKPLIELSDLHRFADKVKSQMWGKQFYDAAQQVIGIAASPLEVAGVMLLSRSRRLGGAGFRYVYLNDLTPLSVATQSIAGQKVCYGDIVIVNPILMKAVIIEIQGEVIHGSGAVLNHDAERMTALQSMGFDVFLVTHNMLNDKKQLDAIVKSVCNRLGVRYKAKTGAMGHAETRLRANVLCNWLEIGN